MRVLYFSRDYTTHDHRFLASLAESGDEVFFLRLERRGRQLEDRALPEGVTQILWAGGNASFHWSRLPGLLAELRGIIRKIKPDLLHSGPLQTCAFLAALGGFHPLVSMSWGSDLLRDADHHLAYHWITTYVLRRSDVLLGDCEAVKAKAIAFGCRPEHIYIFPWGIDLARFSPGNEEEIGGVKEFRARLGWQDCFVVLSNRSWEPVYGIDVALKGFARAAQVDPHLRLLLLGGGSLAPLVHRVIQQYDLADRVSLLGQVTQSELPKIYRSADLYLSASHSDGSSVSLMEALACARPVLVSDIPSNREWVTPGEEGWLFTDGDESALMDGIQAACRNPQGLVEMGCKARLKAEWRADWKKNFQVLKQAYRYAQSRD